MKIVACDFNNEEHRHCFGILLNEYIIDVMGGGRPLNNDEIKKCFDLLKAHADCFILFAEMDDDFAGMIVCFFGVSTFSVAKLINIHDIIVKVDYRKNGIGTALLNEVIKRAKDLDCVKVTLEVRHDNHVAQSMYKKLGFNAGNTPMLFWQKYIL